MYDFAMKEGNDGKEEAHDNRDVAKLRRVEVLRDQVSWTVELAFIVRNCPEKSPR